MRIRCAVLGLALVLASRGAGAKPNADRPPAELLVSVAVGPASTLRGLQAYVDAIEPGAGAQLSDPAIRAGLASAIGARSLDGIDPAAWIHVLIGDAKGARGIAVLVKVADAKLLSSGAGANHVMVKDSWAVVGPRPLVERVGAYALTTMASQPTPAAPTATVYLPHVLARYRTEIATFRRQLGPNMAQLGGGSMAALMESYISGVLSAAADTDKLVVTLEATAATASVDLALLPRPGSRLARFGALQRPSDYALLGKLPPVTATFLVAGHFETGPYRDGMLDLMSAMYGATAAADLRRALGAVFKATTGEVAMAMAMAPGATLTMTQLFGVSDAIAADKAIGRALDLFKAGRTLSIGGISTTTRSHPATTTHDGVTLRRYDTIQDLSKLPAAQREAMERMSRGGEMSARIATFDDVGMLAVAPDSAAQASRAIDAVRGKGPRFVASAAIRDLIAGSRDRKESLVIVVDTGAFMASFMGAAGAGVQPFVLSLGFADGSTHFRMAAPATTVRTLKNAKP